MAATIIAPLLGQKIDNGMFKTFDDWMRFQGFAAKDFSEQQLDAFRQSFDQMQILSHRIRASTFKPRGESDDRTYAIAIPDGDDLRLTFWIKCSARGEYFVFYPRPEGDPHASYHCDGRYHHKSHAYKHGVQRRQPLTGFTGSEHLGHFAGHGVVGPKCYGEDFTDMLVAPSGILDGRRGAVLVDLIELGCAAQLRNREFYDVHLEATFRECSPWIAVAIVTSQPLAANASRSEWQAREASKH